MDGKKEYSGRRSLPEPHHRVSRVNEKLHLLVPIELTQLWAASQPIQQIALGGVDGTNIGEQIRMAG